MAGLQGYVETVVTAAAARPAADASIFAGRVMSWAALIERAARIAGGLRSLGVAAGDRVAILSANSDLVMALYLAIPWAGGVLTPLNIRWSAAENCVALDDCAPVAAFVDPAIDPATLALFDRRLDRMAVIALGDQARSGWHRLADLAAHDPAADAGRGGDDLFGLFYTGGTTGRPKGVMISHAGLVGNAQAMRALGLGADRCRMLIVAPLFHMAAAAALTMAMAAGGTAVILPGFDPAHVPEAIARDGVTEALLVPTMIQMMLDAPDFDPAALAGLRAILYGASPMPEAVLDRILAAAPHVDFYQAYGMTEVSCTATILPPAMHRGDHRRAGRHRAAGRPLATTEVIVADDAGRPLPAGQVGEILVRGPGVMLGYWRQPQQTAAAIRDGWMHTGDGGRIDDQGLLHVVDRLKDMIVSGGENVYPAEVEGAIARYPGVAQCAVIGIPDQRWGERVHAIVRPLPGVVIDEADLIAHCRRLIADYKAPRSVELWDRPLPMSSAGKILKAELRAPHWRGRSVNVG